MVGKAIYKALRVMRAYVTNWIVITSLIEGDVAYMEAFGQPIIILSSYDAAYDLFVKRSSIYSDRPRFPVCREL